MTELMVPTRIDVMTTDLSVLATEIRDEHRQAEQHAAAAILHAMAAGDRLIQAKALCGHGAWLPWLEASCGLGERRAQRYMYLAEHRAELEAKATRVSDLSLRQATALLASPPPALLSSVSNEYYTPAPILDAARAVMGGIDLDPASCAQANATVQASAYYSAADDGLAQPWSGRVWLNPPYGREPGEADGNQARWSDRLLAAYRSGTVEQAILLVNAVPSNAWFQPLMDYPICFTASRIRFHDPAGELGSPTHSNALVYFGPHADRFRAIFDPAIGTVMHRQAPTLLAVPAPRETVMDTQASLAQAWTESQLERRDQLEAGIAAVASRRDDEHGQPRDAALRAWAYQQKLAVVVDRTSDWGNPFEMPGDGDRAAVCFKYAEYYLPHKPQLLLRLPDLIGKLLICWCHPEQCHGDHLARRANGLDRAMRRPYRPIVAAADD